MHAKVWRWKGKIFDDVKTSFSQHLLATFMDCDVGGIEVQLYYTVYGSIKPILALNKYTISPTCYMGQPPLPVMFERLLSPPQPF